MRQDCEWTERAVGLGRQWAEGGSGLREAVGRSDDDFHLEEEGLPTDSTPSTFFLQINAH